jgi:hypothetical protein
MDSKMNSRRAPSITLAVLQAVAFSGFLFSSALAEEPDHSSMTVSLAGTWRVRLDPGDVGAREQWQHNLFSDSLRLPGSLTTNNTGDDLSVKTMWTGSIIDSAWFNEAKFAPYRQPGNIKLPFWLTPQKHFVGAAWYQRELLVPVDWQGKDVHLFLERVHWETQVWVDETSVGTQNSLCAPHEYALGTISPGRHRLVIRVDNTPKINVGRDAHSICDHTQTNWNGIIGRMELQAFDRVRIADLQVYPDIEKRTARVRCVVVNTGQSTLNADIAFTARSTTGPTHQAPPPLNVQKSVPPGEAMVEVDLRMGNDVRLWDEFSPVLYALDAKLSARQGKKALGDHKRATFGMREFRTRGTNFTINGRVTFLRGTLEGCVFPLTGYPPTETPEWERVFKAAKDYGLNHIRFHSWCPPDAAFEAADRLGIILHIETPVWTTLGEDPAVDAFIYAESDRILKEYGNHPSFCMLAVGNEPSGEKRNAFLAGIVSSWKKKDHRRLYTTCSGWPILPESDYNSTPEPRVQNVGFAIKSRFNTQPLSTDIDYTSFISQFKVPTVSHEVGQWCVFPDLKETNQYTGILKARNFEIVRDDLEHKKMLDQAEDFLMASGKLQVLEYKEEIEAALRTPGFGGFQLLGLHDFPGQGTALVGVLNAFWRPKGYVSAEQFRQFCSNAVPLMRMKKVVWTTGEQFAAEAQFANYSTTDLRDAVAEWSLKRPDGTVFASGILGRQNIRQGRLNSIGPVTASLRDISRATKLTLTLGLRETEYTNSWDIWVYPEKLSVQSSNKLVVATEITPEAEGTLAHGGTVLLMANPKRINSLVPPGFSSIFWNTSWSGKQPPHTLGILCNPKHPLFAEFPTESHSTWQWWDIISNSRAMVLDSLPGDVRPLVQVIDDWNTNRKLGLVFEARVARGKLFVCGIDLTSDVEKRPVARQLLRSLLLYVSGAAFQPQATVDLSLIRRLFRQPTIMDEAKFVRVDSEVRGFEGSSAVDGDPTTFWHTPWEGDAPGYPHFLELDLGKPIEIRGYSLQPRTDGITGGWIAKASISLSDDGVHWSAPASTESFERNKEEKRVLFTTPVRTRFVRLTALEGFAGQGFASIAEFRVIGAGE